MSEQGVKVCFVCGRHLCLCARGYVVEYMEDGSREKRDACAACAERARLEGVQAKIHGPDTIYVGPDLTVA